MNILNEVKIDDDSLVYGIAAKDFNSLCEVCQHFMCCGLYNSNLFRNCDGDLILEITDDLYRKDRTDLTMKLMNTYPSVKCLGRKQVRDYKDYAGSHGTYLVQYDAIETVVEQCM